MALEGIYKHFKGNYYYLIGLASIVNDGEKSGQSSNLNGFVLYRQLYGPRKLFIRPRDVFFGFVENEDVKDLLRFEKADTHLFVRSDAIVYNRELITHCDTEEVFKIVSKNSDNFFIIQKADSAVKNSY